MTTLFWMASLETRNFSFEAGGLTEMEALTTLKQGLSLHAKRFNLEDDWYTDDDIVVTEMKAGVAYRDREEITDLPPIRQ